MADNKDMQLINHILTKHKIPAVLIAVSVFALVYYAISSSQAATSYAPGETFNPTGGPGDAFVEFPAGWGLTGTSGTVDGTNFIGTTDNVPLSFKVFNQRAGKIDTPLESTFFGYQSGNAATTGNNNAAFGQEALSSNTTGSTNVAVGNRSLGDNTTGGSNTASGFQALRENETGNNNTAFGFRSLLQNTTGGGNTAVGLVALSSNTIGNNNTAIGFSSGSSSTGDGNVFIGYQAGSSETGSDTLYIDNSSTSTPLIFGDFAGDALTINGDLTITGTCTGCGGGGGWSLTGNSGLTAGTNFIGMTDDVPLVFKVNNVQSGRIESDNDTVNTSIGYHALDSATTGNGNIAFGANALTSNTTGGSNVAIGFNALADNTTENDNTAVGNAALANNTTGGSNNAAFGSYTLNANTSGGANTAFGSEALSLNISGNNNTAVGRAALYNNNTASANVAVGYQALYANTTGVNNVAVGSDALRQNVSGAGNTAIGDEALFSNTTTANTAVGYNALFSTTSGGSNTSIGYEAGFSNTTGTGNVFIGYNAGYSATGSNELWIDNVDDATPLIFGDFSSGEVGIGTTSPESLLHVASSETGDGVEIGRFTWDTSSNGDDAHILLYAPNAFRGGTLGFRNDVGSSMTGIFLGDVNGNPQLFISETGDVGIGDESPVSKLSIPSLSASPVGANTTPSMVCIDDDGGFWKDSDGTFDCQ